MVHRLQFPALQTYHYACDVRVIRILHQRGLGNSATQLQKKLTEQHSQKWLARTIQYLNDCQYFRQAASSDLLKLPQFDEPPEFY